ncbi:NADPH-dependent 7-cyano-7-deazaguanine reductase QueF [Lysobacter pythonis]|uniref:NADPH-dependent 7-cyano-7-deazaguanine reductase n=1 Tax=Solilutibacter pythonis TaxID=2483112 RepID=A0A3M2I0V5_9GAMM|nr:NADPH-dependent 7-cyano-7-deazaguanine reductase QueF [Lysobacter pythonis]RMH93803.1 NADPH-dependent 7-cyano-7-deazaguanine reductase QueF [Lysobacter pythonis]
MSTAHNSPDTSQLGRETAYPEHYDARLLFPIPRARGRAALGIDGAPPFVGFDAWNAYELSWLDARGKPRVAVARFTVPADSPNLIESKSFKLYLNSFNRERVEDDTALRARIETDLSTAAAAPVTMHPALPPMGEAGGECIDGLDIAIDDYGPPNAGHLSAADDETVEEILSSHLLKSNCPVTGQPDWASVVIAYRGPRIAREGLLRYLVSFRDHREFHEQCVERIFIDLTARCRPRSLSVEACYTRRGGLDINPWRATPDCAAPPPRRLPRQ